MRPSDCRSGQWLGRCSRKRRPKEGQNQSERPCGEGKAALGAGQLRTESVRRGRKEEIASQLRSIIPRLWRRQESSSSVAVSEMELRLFGFHFQPHRAVPKISSPRCAMLRQDLKPYSIGVQTEGFVLALFPHSGNRITSH